MTHIVFAGNPGSGKSTIVNSCLGEIISSSGPPLINGYNRPFVSHRSGNDVYSDTPGLDELQGMEKTWQELSKVISKYDSLKIIFVITMECGRLRPSDVSMMKLVLRAIQRQGMDTAYRYSLIINRLYPHEYLFYKSDKNMSTLLEIFSNISPINSLLFLKSEANLEDKSNCILNEAQNIKKFVDNAPTINGDSLRKVNLDISTWNAVYKKAESLLLQYEKFH